MLKNIGKNSQKKNGYTLIELLVYIALFGAISLIMMGVFAVVNRTNAKIVSYTAINTNAYSAMDRMIYEIANSGHVYTPTSNFVNFNYNALKASQLSLATAQGAVSPEGLSYVDFYLENETIFLKKEGASPIALTSPNISVQNLQFSYYKNDSRESVKIDFIVKSKSVLDTASNIHLATVVALR